MNLVNIKNDEGFIRKSDLKLRMQYRSPPENCHYLIEKLSSGSFARVGITYYDSTNVEICKIYCGNKELYEHVSDLFHCIAKELNFKAISDKWKD